MKKQDKISHHHFDPSDLNDAKNDFRSIAENIVIKEDKSNSENIRKLSNKEKDQIVHELRVHQVQLEMQNEELIRVRSELESAKSRYYDIYDMAPEGYLIISEEGTILESNLTAATMLGIDRTDIIKQRFSRFICKEDKDIYYFHKRNLFGSLEPQEDELRLIKNDGTEFWGHIKSVVVTEGGSRICRMALSDISARKQVEEIAKDSAYRFYSLFNAMSSGAAIYKVLNDGSTGKDYIVMDFNKTALQMEGKEKNDVLGKSLYDLRPNIDEYGLIPVFRKVWETGESAFFPTKVYIDDNYNNWYENRIFKLPSGEIVAIYDDVTEKMLINEKLKESENKYRQIAENISDVVWVADLDLNTTYISSSVEKLLGEPVGTHLKRTLEEKFPSDSLRSLYSMQSEEMETEKELERDLNRSRILELEQYRVDGELIWVSLHISFIRDERGDPIGFIGVTRDITKRKRIEAQLQQSMNDLLESQRIAHIGTWRLDLATNQVVWSDELYKMYGFDPTIPPPPYTEHMKLFTPESWDKLSTSLELTRTSGIPYELELETVTKDGSNGWIWVHGKAETDSEGSIISLWGVSRDITEHKRTQSEITETKEYFETMFNTNLDAALVTKLSDGNILSVNDGFSKLTGYSRAEAAGKTVLDLNLYYEPTDRHRITNILKENGYCIGEELLFQRADKSIFTGFISAKLITLKGIDYIVTNVHDITNRKEAEYNLRKSEEKYRSLFDQSTAGIYVHDMEGRIIDVNNAACLQLKYTKEELLNLNVFDLFPNKADTVNLPKDEILHQWNHWQLGQHFVFEGEHQRKDGTIISVQISTGPVQYEEDKLIMALVQDISERKQAEEAVIHFHNLMRYIIDHNRGAVAVHDRDLKYLYVSQRYLVDYKIKEKDIIGKHHYDVLPDIPQKWRDVHQKALMGEISSAENDSYERDDGSLEWTRWECRPWYESDGSVGGIIIYTEIITDRVKLLEDLKDKEFNLRAAQEIAHIGSFNYDPASDKLVCSDEGLNICGITRKEFSGETDTIMQFIHPDEREYVLDISLKAITENKVMKSEFRIIRESGEERIVDFRVGPVFDKDGDCVRITGTIKDITERKKAESELLYLSYHDHLTGLYNRRFYEEELYRLDTKTNFPLSIIMFDVNGLKLINDSFGHDFGDKLLIKAAKTIKKACRTDDIISRIGGDEFAVILPKTDAEQTAKIAETIKQLAAKQEIEKIELSISYGYDTKINDKKKIIEVMANAENYMYKHKLYERSSSRSKTVDIIMNTLFEKSNRESMHSNRVSAICQAIASKMNMCKDAVDKIRVAGLVHDIGKIGIDEKILNKSGKLSDFELEQIKKHSEIGWRILSSVNEFSELSNIVVSHHERWDGSGYPNGLKGEEISLEARIISVADAYDAMISGRSYRRGITQEEAVIALKRCSGTQFDPQIVDVFVNQVLPYGNNFVGGGGVTLTL